MTLKSIVRAISNDKILSILALFSVILIGTLMYYNLSAKLLNSNMNTLEYFEDEDYKCQPMRELYAYPEQYTVYEITDEEGNPKKKIIVDETEKLNKNVDMTTDVLNKYLNKLNENFNFGHMRTLFADSNIMNVTEIKKIIVEKVEKLQKHGVNSDIIERNMGTRYDRRIFNILNEFITSEKNDNDKTATPTTKYYEHKYISKLYKLILTLSVSMDLVVTGLKVQENMEKANTYINMSNLYRPYKSRTRKNLKKLIKLHLLLSVISNQELFQNIIEFNLVSNYVVDDSGTPQIHPGQSEDLDPETLVFTLKNNLDSLTDFIKDNSGEQIQRVISRFGSNLNTTFKTTQTTYEHIFNRNRSIIEKYTPEEYNECIIKINLDLADASGNM